MRIVDQASHLPHHCAVLPYVGNGKSRFFDTGTDLDRQRVYVSFVAVCEMARQIGWIAPSAKREFEDEIASLQARIEELEADLADEQRKNDSIEFLGTKDFIARQKRGPKKGKETAKAV